MSDTQDTTNHDHLMEQVHAAVENGAPPEQVQALMDDVIAETDHLHQDEHQK